MWRSLNPAVPRRSHLPRSDEDELELDKDTLRLLELELSSGAAQQLQFRKSDLEEESQRSHMDSLRNRHKKAVLADAATTLTSSVLMPSSLGHRGVTRARSSPSLSKQRDSPYATVAGTSSSSRKPVVDTSWVEPPDEWQTSCLDRLASDSRRRRAPSPGVSQTASPLVSSGRKKFISVSNATTSASPAKSSGLAQEQIAARMLTSVGESDLPSMVDHKSATRAPQLIRSRSSPLGTAMASPSKGSKLPGRRAAPSSHRLGLDRLSAEPELSRSEKFHFMPPGSVDVAPPRSEIDRLNARLEGMQADMKSDMRAANAQKLIDFLQKHDLMSLHEALVRNGIDGVYRLILMDSQQLSALLSRCNADGMDEITLLAAVRDMQNFPM